LLNGEIVVSGYPLPMIHAEKLITAVQRGVANTRWRDFADIYTLARRHDVDGADLSNAILQVTRHRQVSLVPLNQVLDGYAPPAQRRWTGWRRKHRLDDRLPERFEQVLGAVIAFGDPAISQNVADRVWSAAEQAWLPRKH